MVNVLDSDIVINEFELESHFCIHFENVMDSPLSYVSKGLDSTTSVLLQG